jgi:tRNA dimethylallyltransferase
VIITGPTASGKTAVTIRLAKFFHTEIISADSRQFYRGMNIGTAKPSADELNAVKHHFIDSIDVTEKYNISRYEEDALRIIHELFKSHDIVFMTGGSGMYIDAVCYGLDELPDSDTSVREKLNAVYKEHGIVRLQNMLLETDPEYFAETDINNPHRIIRALEVAMISGEKYSSMRKGIRKKRDFGIIKTGILTDRDELYKKINDRVDKMILAGLEEEVRGLLPYRNEQALQTVGYRELISYFDKEISFGQAVEMIKQNTRNYAKRQMTWLRRDSAVKWMYAEEFTPEKINSFLKSWI